MNTNNQTSRGGGGRDDCWTESATETLIESWGDRYLQLNRGNLRQNDWRDVANAVNSHRDKSKPPRTDVQCKNRIDTLKKKYKAEKSKSKLTPSKWPFYYRLDDLIGTVNAVGRKKLSNQKSASVVTLTVKPKPNPNSNPNLKDVVYCDGSSSRDNDNDNDDDDESLEEVGEKTTACKELAKSIVRFGEVYERIENLKQEEMMELEKKRIEFAREVEFQRLNMFMETQLEIEKMKMKMMMKKKKKPSSTGLLTTGKKAEV